MKQIQWSVLFLALGVGLAACGDAPDASNGDATTAEQTMEQEATAANGTASRVVYVDVRTPEEYARGHVEGAILIPHDEMDERYQALEQYRDREIVVYCRSGRRSGIAKDILERHGFDNVTNGGGLNELIDEGVPTTRSR